MDSLYTLSLSAVSSAVDQLNCHNEYMEELKSLPLTVIQDMLPYLCPKTLMELQELLEKTDISTNGVWKFHYRKRWPYKYQGEPKIFDLFQVDWNKDYHKRYLRKHFHDVLRASAFPDTSQDALGRGLNYMFTSMAAHRKKAETKIYLETPSETIKMVMDLKVFLPFVSYLAIGASQCQKLLDPSVLTSLRRSVSRMDMHALSNEHFKCLAELVIDLLQKGCLVELNVFNAVVDIKIFYSLLHLCAGHFKQTSSFNCRDVSANQSYINIETSEEIQSSSFQESVQDSDESGNELDDCKSNGDVCSVSLFDDALQRVNHNIASETSIPYTDQELAHQSLFSQYGSKVIADPDCGCHHKSSRSTCVTPYMRHGLKAFSIVSPSKMDPWLTEICHGVLPNWSGLDAISLSRVDLCKPGFAATLAQCTGKPWQLKEIILEDCQMSYYSLFTLLGGIICCPTRTGPMHRFKVANVVVKETSHDLQGVKFPEELCVFRTFELHNVTLDWAENHTFFKMIILAWYDKALQNLSLTSVTPKASWFQQFWNGFKGQNLLTFQLNSFSITEPEEEDNLCCFFHTLINVQSLNLNSLLFDPNFVVSERFLDALSSMKNLQHLSISNCRIGNNVAVLLEKVLTRSRHGCNDAKLSLRSVDISYTACSESALEEAAASIIQEDYHKYGSVVKHLDSLKLNGNHFKSPNFPKVTQWRQLVIELEATTEFCAMPFADYVSMM